MLNSIDDEWHLLPKDWWKHSFSSVSWTYPPSSRRNGNFGIPPRSSNVFARPPYYHQSLFTSPRNRSPQPHCSSETGDLLDEKDRLQDPPELNPELPGVKAAEEVIRVYESDVGFHFPETTPPVTGNKGQPLRPETHFHQDKWNELMRDLSGSHERKRDLLSSAVPCRSLKFSAFADSWSDASTSTFSSMDLSSSITSGSSLSMPSTPMPKGSYASVVTTTSPSPLSLRSSASPVDMSNSKRLKATASTFVPVSTPPLKSEPSRPPKSKAYPTITNFTFPSLSVPPVPSVKIQKDAQGFYSGIDENVPSSPTRDGLLPAFLHDSAHRKKGSSRTRAMVDRLRSTSQEPVDKSLVRRSISLNPSPVLSLDDEVHVQPRMSVSESGGDLESFVTNDDGWVSVHEDTKGPISKDSRTQELFRALRRHRSNSNPNRHSCSSDENTDGRTSPSLSTPALSSSSTVSSPSSSIKSSNDGWIEGSGAAPSKTKHKRRQSSNSRQQVRKKSQSSVPSMPFLSKPIYPYPGYPYGSPFIPPSHPAIQYTPGVHSYFYANYPPVAAVPMNPAYPGYVPTPVQYTYPHARPPMLQANHQMRQHPPSYVNASRPYAI